MKNQFFLLLLSCFFLLGNTPFAEADELGLDGGVIVPIDNGKTGKTVLSFSIPDIYLNKDGNLAVPLQITLTKNGKISVFFAQTKDLHFVLPSYLSGNYDIKVGVGDYQITRRITL